MNPKVILNNFFQVLFLLFLDLVPKLKHMFIQTAEK